MKRTTKLNLFYSNIPNSTTTTPVKVAEGNLHEDALQYDVKNLMPKLNSHEYSVDYNVFVPVEITKTEPTFENIEIEWQVGQNKCLMTGNFMIWKKDLVKLEGQDSFFKRTDVQPTEIPLPDVPIDPSTTKDLDFMMTSMLSQCCQIFANEDEESQNRHISFNFSLAEIYRAANLNKNANFALLFSKKMTELDHIAKKRKQRPTGIG